MNTCVLHSFSFRLKIKAVPKLKRLVAGFPPRRPGFDPRSAQVVDKVALARVFSEYFGFPCQSSFHQILHHHNHSGQATIGQSVAAVPSGPSWTTPPTKRIKKKKISLEVKSIIIVATIVGLRVNVAYYARSNKTLNS
jgi:hypothetical protein